ncbi:alpha/beta hydrolase [Gordonia sp. CPCC 205515]|uniref:alpha/beta fold hydrolase n=1 Tax=Gordonia sp. CPCC 205515 TaxID=3140791 RepID=UPI003AF3AFFE
MPTPIVLVHGLRVGGASLHRIAQAITDRPVLTPDLPGHGTRSTETFSMGAAVAAVRDAVESLGGHAVVAGMSLGGYVAMATAARHPAVVDGVVAMGATAQPSRLLAAPFQAFGVATSVLPRQAAWVSMGLTRLAVGRRVATDMEAGGLALHSIRDVVDELAAFDALDAVSRYRGPVEFLNGGWDQFRIHEARFVAAADARLQILPRATHLFPLIQPVRTAEAITAFARRCDVAAQRQSTT